jgi:hypothetical protein
MPPTSAHHQLSGITQLEKFHAVIEDSDDATWEREEEKRKTKK